MLVGATLLALGLWCFERSRWKSHRLGMGLATAMLVLALVPVVAVTRLSSPAATATEGVVAFSPQLLDRLRADNRVVFVNMTADWCVTCKANEKNVLSSAEFRDALRRVDAVYMKGDWTNVDPPSAPSSTSTRPSACRCTWSTAPAPHRRSCRPC